jgi:cbb3-type cytochrome oxidase maturation protein
MGILFLLIGISLFMGLAFLIAFFWAVEDGQFEDSSTPALRIFEGEDETTSLQP